MIHYSLFFCYLLHGVREHNWGLQSKSRWRLQMSRWYFNCRASSDTTAYHIRGGQLDNFGVLGVSLFVDMNYGHPEKAFFLKIPNFWAWADKFGRKFWGYLGYFRPNCQHPFWYSESLVHVFYYSTIGSTKITKIMQDNVLIMKKQKIVRPRTREWRLTEIS